MHGGNYCSRELFELSRFACANVCYFLSSNPFEVVKQQVQLRLHETTAEGFSAVWRLEGPRGFFVGMGTSMLRDVPFAALQLSLWEWMKVKALGELPAFLFLCRYFLGTKM